MESKKIKKVLSTLTPEEQEYIKNDVLVVKEALEIMFTDGHKKLKNLYFWEAVNQPALKKRDSVYEMR